MTKEEQILDEIESFERENEEHERMASETELIVESEADPDDSEVLEFAQSLLRIEPKALGEDPQDKVAVRFKANLGQVTIRNGTMDLFFRKGEWPFVLDGGKVAEVGRTFWQNVLHDCGVFELVEEEGS